MVKLEHPALAQVIEVAESAVPFHMASGWRLVESISDETPTESTSPRPSARRANKED